MLSSVNGHSSITVYVTASMSLITSGMHNFHAVNTLKPSNKFALGGPIFHVATCVACVWIEIIGRFVCGPTSYPAIYGLITIICPNYRICLIFSGSCIIFTAIVKFMDKVQI